MDKPVRGRTARGPRGHRAYAIGDIHGRLDLLDDMLERIADDVATRRRRKTVIVFVGDLIDRGPQSAQVIERLRTYRPDFAETVFLMGNHEEVLLQLLAGRTDLLRDWLKFGGAECAESYGLDPEQLRTSQPTEALAMLRKAIPASHRDFIEGFADTVSFGSYVFVHAGIRPGVPLADQVHKDMRWIRQPFLSDLSDHGFVVVHGHTICNDVEEHPNRIAIDTGAYRSGTLSAVAIEGRERWYLRTGRVIGPGTDVDRDPDSERAKRADSRALA